MGENWLSKQQTLESEVLGVSGGPSKRRLAIATVVVAACGALTLLAGGVTPAQASDPVVESALIQAAKAAPGDSFKVIVQGEQSGPPTEDKGSRAKSATRSCANGARIR